MQLVYQWMTVTILIFQIKKEAKSSLQKEGALFFDEPEVFQEIKTASSVHIHES